jgi:hypothetical protein
MFLSVDGQENTDGQLLKYTFVKLQNRVSKGDKTLS